MIGTAPGKDRTGYLSLPPEIRSQILKQTLISGSVRPYRGQTAHGNWQRDFEIVIAAHRHAWKGFILHPDSTSSIAAWEAIDSYWIIMLAETPTLCSSALAIGPHFLSVCRTAYEEGHVIFYSQNTFYLPCGPLSHTRDYYDHLRPKHQKLIRKMVLELTIFDLDITAFDEIERDLCAKDVVNGRLPADKSVEDWVAPIAYNIISTWRSKLAWLQDWTWLEEATITCRMPKHLNSFFTGYQRILPAFIFTISGEGIPILLRGIGPKEPHCPVMDCYGDCNEHIALCMKALEVYLWALLQKLIKGLGWKTTKALIRRYAYGGKSGRIFDEDEEEEEEEE
ncbi:MAG: hypothetical protein Q9170_004847 [Blastenia crenularia]